MIKPDFFDSDSLAAVHPMTRFLFIGLWVIADDAGNLKYNPRKIRLQVFPYDEIPDREIELQLSQLEKIGCIYGYEADGERLITIPNFLTYQTINRPSKSTIPAPKKAKNEGLITKWISGGKQGQNMNTHGVFSEYSVSTHSNKVSKEGRGSTYNSSFLPTGKGGAGAEKPRRPSTVELVEIFDAPTGYEPKDMEEYMANFNAQASSEHPDAIPCPDNLKAVGA